VTSDTFAVVGLSRHPLITNALAVRKVKMWKPREGKTHEDRAINLMEIEEWFAEFCRNHNVLRIAFDPKDTEQMMQQLRARRIAPVVVFQQGARRERADRALYDAIQHKRIWHNGDVNLRQHVQNADRKVTDDRNIRIVKRTASRKIDGCVALSMAHDEARMLWRPKPRIQGTSAAGVF
jgi:phage terminase large subunit-like protein